MEEESESEDAIYLDCMLMLALRLRETAEASHDARESRVSP